MLPNFYNLCERIFITYVASKNYYYDGNIKFNGSTSFILSKTVDDFETKQPTKRIWSAK